MATFNYTVDTTPMADEMRSVSKHVNATTGAVVAMQTAVIIAEGKAADRVCDNVNKGFYSLIRSQISQKMAKLQSDVDSHIMQLVQQKNALLGIQGRMQKDYGMISNRYFKLFNSLNANLKTRVFELDKPTIDFANKEVQQLANRSNLLTATIPISQVETLSMSQKIMSSNVKQKGLEVIHSMKGFIREMNNQKKLTNQILINDNRYIETAVSYMPILLCERDTGATKQKDIEIVLPATGLNSYAKTAISNHAYGVFNTLNWRGNNQLPSEVKSHFSKLLSASGKPKRVLDLASRMFEKNASQTLN